jgi:hypothetical protein
MTEPLNASMIFDQLRALGFSNSDMTRNAFDDGWRVRTGGGPVIHIYDNGKLVIAGRQARVLRKALGLSGERETWCKIDDLTEKR